MPDTVQSPISPRQLKITDGGGGARSLPLSFGTSSTRAAPSGEDALSCRDASATAVIVVGRDVLVLPRRGPLGVIGGRPVRGTSVSAVEEGQQYRGWVRRDACVRDQDYGHDQRRQRSRVA
jgi:hypothetical protein